MHEKGQEKWEEFKNSEEQRQKYLDSVFYYLPEYSFMNLNFRQKK